MLLPILQALEWHCQNGIKITGCQRLPVTAMLQPTFPQEGKAAQPILSQETLTWASKGRLMPDLLPDASNEASRPSIHVLHARAWISVVPQMLMRKDQGTERLDACSLLTGTMEVLGELTIALPSIPSEADLAQGLGAVVIRLLCFSLCKLCPFHHP